MILRAATAALLTCGITLGQSAPTPIPAKLPAFEVVSIRPSKPGVGIMSATATTDDGYSIPNQPLLFILFYAYFPQGKAYWSRDHISGAPLWLNDPYDINAKVSEADLAEWQKESALPLDKKVLFQQMLQSMLADRCHLVAHMASGAAISGYSLEIGKRGPHLTDFKPEEVMPAGRRLPSGGFVAQPLPGAKPHITLYGATMAELAQRLSTADHPVQDHTGLTGRYDFNISQVDDPGGIVSPDDHDPLSHWDVQSLGLRVTPIKIPAQLLVIDHIEKPSEN